MKTIAIADASDAELRSFAEEKYGLNFGPQNNGAKRATIMAKLKAVHESDTIEVGDEDAGEVVQASSLTPAEMAAKQREWGEKLMIIMIPIGEGKNGSQPVFVGAEGRPILIPRGRWCEVKQIFVQSLREAVEEQYSQSKGEDGLAKVSDTTSSVPRFPFQEWHGQGEPPDLMRWNTMSKRAA